MAGATAFENAPTKHRRRSSVAHVASRDRSPKHRGRQRRMSMSTDVQPDESSVPLQPRLSRTSSGSSVGRKTTDRRLQNILNRKQPPPSQAEVSTSKPATTKQGVQMQESFRDLIKDRESKPGTSFRDFESTTGSKKSSSNKKKTMMEFIEEETPSGMFTSEEFDNPWENQDNARNNNSNIKESNPSKLSRASVQMVPVHERFSSPGSHIPNVFGPDSFRQQDLDPFGETCHKRLDFGDSFHLEQKPDEEQTVTTQSTKQSASSSGSGKSQSRRRGGVSRSKSSDSTRPFRRQSSVGMDTSAIKYLEPSSDHRTSVSRTPSAMSATSTSSEPSRASRSSTGSSFSNRSDKSSSRRSKRSEERSRRVPRLKSFEEEVEAEPVKPTKKPPQQQHRRASLGPMGTSISSGMDLFDANDLELAPKPKSQTIQSFSSSNEKTDKRRRRASMAPSSSLASKAHHHSTKGEKPRRSRRASMATGVPRARDPPGELGIKLT